MADAGPAPGFLGMLSSQFFNSPLGLYFFSTFAYALAMTGIGDHAVLERAVLAQGKLLLALCVVLIVSFPYAFAFGEASGPERYIGPWVLFAICAVVSAVVHQRALRSGVPARFEIPAHILVFGVSVLLFNRDLFPAAEAWSRAHLFGQLPRLVALVPFIAIVVVRAPPATMVHSALIAVIAIVPIYFGKAAFDLALQRPMPLLWPVRVVVDFVPAEVRSARFKQLRTVLRPGVAVRVGAHWYRFQHFRGYSMQPNLEGLPDRLVSLYLYFATAEFGLPEKRNLGTEIHIVADSQGPTAAPNVGVRYEDLTIEIKKDDQPGWPSDDKIREILLAFISAARVPYPPPPGGIGAR
jgi:hypothetical protein